MKEHDSDFLYEINQEIGTLMGQEAAAPALPSAERRGQRDSDKRRIKLSRKALSWIIVLSLLVVIFGGGAGMYFFMQHDGRTTLAEHIEVEGVEITAPEEAIVADGGDTITWKGKTYERRDSIVNVLCMGIDKSASELSQDAGEVGVPYGSGGQADTIFLAVLDTQTGDLTLLNLSRDSMTDVDVYNEDGEFVDTRKLQLCLAYAYGDGGDSSCLNMVKSVSNLMYGVPIDAYAAIDLPAINILNDAIGGVEVDVLEDLSTRDPSLTEGSHVLLKGNLAETYVRSRNQTDPEANSKRMARQRQYVTAFLRKAYSQIRNDWSVALTMYQAVQAYSHISLRLSQMLYLATTAVQTEFGEQNIITIPGEVVMGEEYVEFYVDEDVLFQTIMDTYYQEVS